MWFSSFFFSSEFIHFRRRRGMLWPRQSPPFISPNAKAMTSFGGKVVRINLRTTRVFIGQVLHKTVATSQGCIRLQNTMTCISGFRGNPGHSGATQVGMQKLPHHCADHECNMMFRICWAEHVRVSITRRRRIARSHSWVPDW